MSRGYIYNRTNNIAAGSEVEIPSDAICIGIVSEYRNGGFTGKKYVEWLQPA